MSAEASRTTYAEKFEKLLWRYPRPDGRMWKMVEIERATGGEVSSAWLSAFRLRKTRKPGMEKLFLISQAMGFPFELWVTDPAQWDGILEDRGISYGPAGPGMPGLTQEDVAALYQAQANGSLRLLYKSIALRPEQVDMLIRLADELADELACGRDRGGHFIEESL